MPDQPAAISTAHFDVERDAGEPPSKERKKLRGHIAGWMADEDKAGDPPALSS
ncbi:hypothetical protein HD597_012828 [Nonomuraea thailandensis]|uniref:Uncharacterized protein n=1 Tax=Nonomuraea thailandensis TaxID=1188745 RepID=A0A9X2KAK8_9ACTN|nr:hypothetical protein [Nonomuraea thailandensis]MCP2365724.1 hypothetical protein [Nonomuraea thailandensis]